MGLRNVTIGTLGLTFLLLAGCGGAGSGEPMKVAERFMDQYYRKANIAEAKALATPAIAEKIDGAAAATAGIKSGDREVTYMVREKDQKRGHSYFVYETTIASKEARSVRKEVYLSVDKIDGVWKVVQFEERAAGSAVPPQQ